MSLKFDLTIIAPELLDSVVCMDNSPAYEAFKTETAAILSDFNKTEHFGSSLKIDENALIESCEDTLRNMHESFFVWLCRDELHGGRNIDSGYSTYLKLCFRSCCDKFVSLNGGSRTIAPGDIADFKKKVISEIANDPSLYKSIRDYFAGYIYGYFFNFLTEQTSMVKYAEFLVCMGIMTGKLASSVAAQQKILLRMASLLSHDRIKYASGFVPLELACEIIRSRFAFPSLSADETAAAEKYIKDYLTSHYEMQKDDEGNDLISVKLFTSAMTEMNSFYTSVKTRSAEIFGKCFEGERVFLDGSGTDTGDITPESIAAPLLEKCAAEALPFYDSGREPIIDVSLESGMDGYKFPLICKDGDDYWYSPVYSAFADKVTENDLYKDTDSIRIPDEDFPFVTEMMKTDSVREFLGMEPSGCRIRKDKESVLGELSRITGDKTLAENEKKMLVLEKLLRLSSGNCSAEKYNSAVEKNIFGTKLFDEYVDFRISRLCAASKSDIDAKKKLLDDLNKIG